MPKWIEERCGGRSGEGAAGSSLSELAEAITLTVMDAQDVNISLMDVGSGDMYENVRIPNSP